MNKTYEEWLKYYENATKEQVIEDMYRDIQEIKQLKDNRDKAIELLGNYKHYCVPDELSNRENEDLVDKSYEILKGE